MSGGLEDARAAAGRGQERHSSSLPSRLRKYYKRQRDQPSGRSFMQILCEKHSPENVPFHSGPGMGVNIPASPQGSAVEDRHRLPRIQVLDGSGTTCAGDEEGIATLCAQVSELDLSDNKFEDGHEVLNWRACSVHTAQVQKERPRNASSRVPTA